MFTYTTLRDRVLDLWTLFVLKYPKKVLFFFLAMAFLSGVYTVSNLEVMTNQDELVSKNLDYYQHYERFLKDFGDREFIHVIVQVENKARAIAFLKTLAARLLAEKDIRQEIQKLIWKADITWDNALFFLKSADLEGFKESILRSQGLDLGQWLRFMHQSDAFKESLFFVLDRLKTALTVGQDGGAWVRTSKLAEVFEAQMDQQGYLFSDNGRLMYMLILPNKDYETLSVIQEPLNRIRRLVQEVQKEFPNVKVGLTGRPVLQADEMRVTQEDMFFSSIVAILGVSLVFVLFFGNSIRPLLAVFVLIISIVLTFGFTTLVVGSLNILSIVFTIILVGLGIDFGIHVLSRYQEELKKQATVKRAVHQSILICGKGNLTAGLTSGLAFYMAGFLDFKGLSELGLIAGTGILITLVAMMSLFPALLFLWDKRKKANFKIYSSVRMTSWYAFVLRHSRVLLGFWFVSAVVWLLFLFGAGRLSFNSNLLELHAPNLESVEYEHKMIQNNMTSWFLVSMVDWEELGSRIQAFRSLSQVRKVESILDYTGPKKQAILNQLAVLSNAPNGKPAHRTDVLQVIQQIEHQTPSLKSWTSPLKKALAKPQSQERMELFEAQLLQSLRGLFSKLVPAASVLSPQNLPEMIQDRFVGGKEGNRFALYLYPKESVWSQAEMAAFVEQVLPVDNKATGGLMMFYKTNLLIQEGLKTLSFLVFVMILILLRMDFKRWRYIGYALTPLVMGLIWLLGYMSLSVLVDGLSKLEFNLANFFAIPMLIGISVDYGAHLVHGQNKSLKEQVVSIQAVVLSGFTTILGLGSLIFAQHRGLSSLGSMMMIGSLVSVLAAVTLLPGLLHRLKRNPKARSQRSV